MIAVVSPIVKIKTNLTLIIFLLNPRVFDLITCYVSLSTMLGLPYTFREMYVFLAHMPTNGMAEKSNPNNLRQKKHTNIEFRVRI